MKRRVIIIGSIVVIGLGVSIGFASWNRNLPVVTVDPPKQSYVALGDSVAAGVGLATDSDSSACGRTNESYPNVVAQAKKYNMMNLACSGATLTNGILGPQDVNRLAVPAQLQQLFTKPRPALITLTIGANDAGWTEFIGRCYVAVCGSSADTTTVDQRLETVRQNLEDTFTQIRQHYGSSVPRVALVGYYQVFPTTADENCVDLAAIDTNELAWGRAMQTSINQALRDAATSYDFVNYIQPDFSGHELCSAEPWVQGLNSPQPYHPTAAGQTQIANDIAAGVR